MITEPNSFVVQARVFYTGLAIAAGLLVADFLLLKRAQATPRQLEIYTVLFTLATVSVVYRYRSSNEQLKRLGARGLWFLIAILVGTGAVFVFQTPAQPRNQPLAPVPAEPGPNVGG